MPGIFLRNAAWGSGIITGCVYTVPLGCIYICVHALGGYIGAHTEARVEAAAGCPSERTLTRGAEDIRAPPKSLETSRVLESRRPSAYRSDIFTEVMLPIKSISSPPLRFNLTTSSHPSPPLLFAPRRRGISREILAIDSYFHFGPAGATGKYRSEGRRARGTDCARFIYSGMPKMKMRYMRKRGIFDDLE